MTSSDSISRCVEHDECDASDNSFLPPTNGSTETFAAFLDKFTEGSWPLPATRVKRSMSFAEQDHDCYINHSDFVDATLVTSQSSVVTRDGSPHQAMTGSCDVTRARPSGSDSSPVAEEDGTETDASCPLDEFFSRGTLLYSSVRKLTNTTYPRRMHMSREDAAELFPEVKSTLELLYRTKMTRRESLAPFKKGTCVYIHDSEGRRWPVVLECLRTAGQRHVRFNKGWAEMCSANGLSIGKYVRLARWKQGSSSSRDMLVTLSIV